MVLKPIGNCTRVGSGVDLKLVRNSVVIQERMQLDGIDAQTILVAHVHRNGAILLEVSYVLIHEGKRRIRGELRDDFRLRNTVFCWQVEI